MRYLWLLLLFFSPVNVFSAVKPLKHEIRAVWLATIYGLDWPQATASVPGEIQKQQLSFCRFVDSLKNANFNTVFLQVRLSLERVCTALTPLSRLSTYIVCKNGSSNPV